MKLFRGITALIAASLAIHNTGSAASGTALSDHRNPFWWLPEHDRGRDVPRPAHRYSKVRGIKLKANRAQRNRLADAFSHMR